MRSIPLGRKPVQMNFDDLLSMKVCWNCKQEKPLTEFHKSRSLKAKDGRSSQCAECSRERSLAYYRANREHRIAYAKEYVERNREKTKEYKRLHYLSRRGAYARRGREYYEANKEYCRARNYKYAQDPARQERARKRARLSEKWFQTFRPEHYKARALKSVHTRRARMAQVEGTISEQEWLALKEKYNYRCLRCGAREPDCKLTMDHVIPISKGGPNTIDNVQSLCHPCNSGKGPKHVDYRPK